MASGVGGVLGELTMTNPSLSQEDALALDVLLDRGAVASQSRDNGPPITYASTAARPERVRAVERVLWLVGQMPGEEPASDLLSRTLHVIGEGQMDGPRPPAQMLGSGMYPHA